MTNFNKMFGAESVLLRMVPTGVGVNVPGQGFMLEEASAMCNMGQNFVLVSRLPHYLSRNIAAFIRITNIHR